MEPGLPPGSYVLFKRKRAYGAGDIVLVNHPRFGRIVKQILCAENGRFALCGTGEQSTSTKDLGVIAPEAILGVQLWASRPPAE